MKNPSFSKIVMAQCLVDIFLLLNNSSPLTCCEKQDAEEQELELEQDLSRILFLFHVFT